MVDREHQPLFARALDHAVAIGRRLRHGLFHKDVAPHIERLQRQRGMRAGRRENVDYLRLSHRHRGERRIDVGNVKLGRQCRGAFLVEVGHADDLDKGQATERPGVVVADVPRAHQSYSDRLIAIQGVRSSSGGPAPPRLFIVPARLRDTGSGAWNSSAKRSGPRCRSRPLPRRPSSPARCCRGTGPNRKTPRS